MVRGLMEETVYFNGRLVPASEARVSAFDYGFLLGFGLFETMRSYDGHIFRLERHLARLMKSAEALGMAPRLGNFDLGDACYQVLKANNLSDARIRLTVSAGVGEIVPDPATCREPTVFIVARKLAPLSDEVYQRGYRVVISSVRRNSGSPSAKHKSTSWLENVLARTEARTAGADEALLLNERGLVVECSASNIFLVRNGALCTPPVESGALPGVTREVVLELAQSLGIGFTVAEVGFKDLFRADEVFLTSSTIEIMPLTQVEGVAIGGGKLGSVTKRLMSAYKELVVREIRARGGG